MATPTSSPGPMHVAIIMDGNGRWAQQRGKNRSSGHRAGLRSVRAAIETCARNGVRWLTLFAFSSENWRRPQGEVRALMALFMRGLQREVTALHREGIRLRFIGERSAFDEALRQGMAEAEALTANNRLMTVVVAVNYGGRWDLVEAARALVEDRIQGRLAANEVDERALAARLALAEAPDPDLFVRTGGERRISNFLLWQLAYTELYFSPLMWPDFDAAAMQAAIDDFRGRQRRFGMTAKQVLARSRA